MRSILFFSITILACMSALAQKAFTEGNLVLLRIGDGSLDYALGTNKAAPIFLDEYGFDANGAIAWVQTIALPTTASGINGACTTSPNAINGGHMSLSGDGQYIAVPGFNTEVQTWPISNEASVINRMVAIVDYNGNINTTTSLNDAYSKKYIRSAATKDGTGVWMVADSGDGTSIPKDGYFRYATVGSNTSTNLLEVTRRAFFAFEGDLYVSSDITIFKVGDKFPTSDVVLTDLLETEGRNTSAYGFCMINLDHAETQKVMYATNSKGAIKKYSLVDGKWTWNGDYTWTTAAVDGPRSVQAKVKEGKVHLYVVCSGATAAESTTGVGKLYELIDQGGYNASFAETGSPVKHLDWSDQYMVMRSAVWAPKKKSESSNSLVGQERLKIAVTNESLTVSTSEESIVNIYTLVGNKVASELISPDKPVSFPRFSANKQLYIITVGGSSQKVFY